MPSSLAPRNFVVLCDRTLKVIVLLAGNETNSLQRCEMLFGFPTITKHQVGFTEVLVRAAVPRIDPQCLLVVPHRRVELPQTAVSIAEIILNIGIAGIA
jgi:hypothetical protein